MIYIIILLIYIASWCMYIYIYIYIYELRNSLDSVECWQLVLHGHCHSMTVTPLTDSPPPRRDVGQRSLRHSWTHCDNDCRLIDRMIEIHCAHAHIYSRGSSAPFHEFQLRDRASLHGVRLTVSLQAIKPSSHSSGRPSPRKYRIQTTV